MSLWLLRPVGYEEEKYSWVDDYDVCEGFVIRAKTEEEARQIADKCGGDENMSGSGFRKAPPKNRPWLHPEMTTCTKITGRGKSELIICDFHHG